MGQAETYARMKSDFLYPELSDRRSIDEWSSENRGTLEETAKTKVLGLLENKPDNVDKNQARILIEKYGLFFDPLSLQPRKETIS